MILSGYIGVHKVVSITQMFGYPSQWAIVLILIIIEAFGLREYQTILYPKAGVWIRHVYIIYLKGIIHHISLMMLPRTAVGRPFAKNHKSADVQTSSETIHATTYPISKDQQIHVLVLQNYL